MRYISTSRNQPQLPDQTPNLKVTGSIPVRPIVGGGYCGAMSQENVEIVMKGIRLFEAEDFSQAPGIWHSNARMTAPEGWPEAGPFEGLDAIVEQFERLASDMGEHHFREVTVVADREDWIVISFLWEIRGAGSGAAIASKIAGAYRVFDGKMGEAHFRWTPEEALEAAGLSDG